MGRYEDPQGTVAVVPFLRQEDGSDFIIGHPVTNHFISLPREAVEVLDLLASRNTLEEVEKTFLEKYGEVPDLEDFLASLEERGFVRPGNEDVTVSAVRAPSPKYHFTFIPERHAQALFSKPVLMASAIFVLLALMALVSDPALVPGWRALFFQRHITASFLLLMTIGLFTTFLHEMAHLTAARAEGVLCRIGISNRLWILVAETDMTGVWLLPRNRRYLPILAGPWLDTVSASFLVLLFYAGRRGWIDLGQDTWRILAAVLMSYLLRLLWQCYFFVRTDFYYVFATFFNCKDLMGDTRSYLRNQLLRVLGREKLRDQQHIPEREMRAVRAYSLFWLAGRGAAFWTLFKFSLPLMFAYFGHIGSSLAHDWRSDRYAFADAMLITVIQLGFTFAGFALWIRSIYFPRRHTQ